MVHLTHHHVTDPETVEALAALVPEMTRTIRAALRALLHATPQTDATGCVDMALTPLFMARLRLETALQEHN